MELHSASQGEHKKYRVLLVRHKSVKSSAGFQNALEDEFTSTLALHCDLTVIDRDFDYGEACDTINPDFVVVGAPGGNRAAVVEIANADARPDIPRIGLFDQDPHDTGRASFFRLLDQLKIDRMFTFGAGAIRQSPELSGRAYTLSLFIDDEVFHDYGLEKNIPVSIFGGLVAPNFYNWRAANAVEVIKNFPTLTYTHPGYIADAPPHRFTVTGAAYARLLNQSRFSLADSTRLDCVVRKHLEIPACGTVLVAPQSTALAAYGFRDMHNCIMDNGPQLLQKIAAIADNADLYSSLQKNGHDLVHSRYTRKKWRGIIDWFECFRSLRPGESVQQQGEVGPYSAVPSGAPALTPTPADSDFSAQMRAVCAQIIDNKLDEAEAELWKLVTWVGHIGEPWFLLGLTTLLRGRSVQVKEVLMAPLSIRTGREGSSCMDPEEMAWLMLAGVMLNEPIFKDNIGKLAAGIHHLSLRRMNWLLSALEKGGALPVPSGLDARLPGDRISMHWTSQLEFSVWLGLINRVLAAYGRPEISQSGPSLARSGT